MRSFFITATDTGIGKTTITAGMALALKNMGVDVGIMKPFATGMRQKTGYKSEDVSILANTIGSKDVEELINPYFFPIPASPYTAATKLNVDIDVSSVIQKFLTLQSLHDVMLVEGIGGILTPILKNYYVADLIKETGLDALVVAGNKLGAVNHTLLTLNVATKYGINVRGVVLNNNDTEGYNLDELKKDLTNLTGIDVLCTVPKLDGEIIDKVAQILRASELFRI